MRYKCVEGQFNDRSVVSPFGRKRPSLAMEDMGIMPKGVHCSFVVGNAVVPKLFRLRKKSKMKKPKMISVLRRCSGILLIR